MFNHEFVPNVIWSCEGRVQRLTACRRVKKGEELTICYRQPESIVERERFFNDYNIPLLGPMWENRDSLELLEGEFWGLCIILAKIFCTTLRKDLYPGLELS